MPGSWRRCLIAVAFIGSGSIFTIAFADTAQAEQCVTGTQSISSLPGETAPTVCLVTDTSQPLVTPATVYFRVPSEATAQATLVEPGPPGGTSLWSMPLYVASEDGVRQIRLVVEVPSALPCDPVTTTGCGTYSYEATFAIPVLSPSGANRMTFRSTKQRVTVSYHFEARKPLLVVPQLYLNAFPKGRTVIVTLRSKKKLFTDLGSHTISVSLPRRVISRKCQPYGGCFVLGWGRSWISEPGLPERAQEADSGTYSPRKRVYRKRRGAPTLPRSSRPLKRLADQFFAVSQAPLRHQPQRRLGNVFYRHGLRPEATN